MIKLFYGINQPETVHDDIDGCIEEYLDQCDDFNHTFEVEVYERVETEYKPAFSPLERMLEDLDEDYGNPDGHYPEPTDDMQEAEQAFIKAVLADYEVWRCETTGEVIKVDGLEWVRKHCPHWLKDSEETQ